MSSGVPAGSGTPGSSSGSAQRIQAQLPPHTAQPANPANIYSFSVHQPYTNWPLHASGATYAPSWYPLPPQSYAQPKSYKENQTQTGTPENEKIRKGEDGKPLYRPHWDAALSTFLKSAGLFEAYKGFREDMLMINDMWEKEQIATALQVFVKTVLALLDKDTNPDSLEVQPLEERKLDYVPLQRGIEHRTPSSMTKSISRLLRESRKRNVASNRTEFLFSLAEKRRRLGELGESSASMRSSPPAGAQEHADETTDKEGSVNNGTNAASSADIPSCARGDAKPQNRELQMKYDIAKNEDGPLKRTMKGSRDDLDSSGANGASGPFNDVKGKQRAAVDFDDAVTAERHPGLAERFRSIETHLAVRYVPSPPSSLVQRIKFLEDHIIGLEKDYPPWAALHFNQPSRGWPPPPRLTPIIVPPHLTSTKTDPDPAPAASGGDGTTSTGRPATQTKGKSSRAKSSLHRAVMEKLEIQRAIGDLTGAPGPSGNVGS